MIDWVLAAGIEKYYKYCVTQIRIQLAEKI